MVRSIVHCDDEKDGGARERRGDRLGYRGRHASLHTDLFGAVILRRSGAKSKFAVDSHRAFAGTLAQLSSLGADLDPSASLRTGARAPRHTRYAEWHWTETADQP